MDDDTIGDERTIDNGDTIGNERTMPTHVGSALGRIDQYELLKELGGGGFGTVYLAKDTVSGIEVAVKGLPPFVRNNREEMENIRSNFALVSRLTHTNIAKALVLHPAKEVVYVSEDVRKKLRIDSGDTMMVMDYAPGVTLSQWRRQFPDRKVPLEQALEITRQIASALDYAHELRIVHRDIKPANVIIETAEDGSVKVRVLDFGLAAEIRSSMGRVSREIHDTSGTRPYMAPEQWLGAKQGPATDQYSLAAMFCELVTGEVPFASVFDTGDPVVMMNAVGREPFAPSQDLPKPIRPALSKALAKRPEERFASCGDFVAALEGNGKFSRKEAGGPRPVAAVKGLLAVAALGLAAFGGWWWMSGREGTKGTQGTKATIGTNVTNVVQVSSGPSVASPAPVPSPTPASPPKAGLTDADVAEIAVEASVQKSRIERIDDADGFQAQKIALDDILNCATTNRKEKLWAEAAQEFTNYVDGCKELLKQDQERQAAKESKAKAESAQKSASNAEAAQYAEQMWNKASTLFKDANDLFGEMSFTNATQRYKDATEQFNPCVGEANRKQREMAEAKAKAEQEKRKRTTKKELELDSQVTIPLTGLQFDQDPSYVRCMDVNFAPVYFAFSPEPDSPLAISEVPKIEAVAQHLHTHPDRVVIVEGNCDERGSNEYNLSLGESRAITVRDYLVQRGVNVQRIHVKSYGEEKPAVIGHEESVWSKNRRCEFLIFSHKPEMPRIEPQQTGHMTAAQINDFSGFDSIPVSIKIRSIDKNSQDEDLMCLSPTDVMYLLLRSALYGDSALASRLACTESFKLLSEEQIRGYMPYNRDIREKEMEFSKAKFKVTIIKQKVLNDCDAAVLTMIPNSEVRRLCKSFGGKLPEKMAEQDMMKIYQCKKIEGRWRVALFAD